MKRPYQIAGETLAALLDHTVLKWHRDGVDSYRTEAGAAEFTVRRDAGRVSVAATCGGRRNHADMTPFESARKLWERARAQVAERASTQAVLTRILGGSTYGMNQETEVMPAIAIGLTTATREERLQWQEIPRSEDRYTCQVAGINAELRCASPVELTLESLQGRFAGELKEPCSGRNAELLRELTRVVQAAAAELSYPGPTALEGPDTETWTMALNELTQARRDGHGLA